MSVKKRKRKRWQRRGQPGATRHGCGLAVHVLVDCGNDSRESIDHITACRQCGACRWSQKRLCPSSRGTCHVSTTDACVVCVAIAIAWARRPCGQRSHTGSRSVLLVHRTRRRSVQGLPQTLLIVRRCWKLRTPQLKNQRGRHAHATAFFLLVTYYTSKDVQPMNDDEEERRSVRDEA